MTELQRNGVFQPRSSIYHTHATNETTHTHTHTHTNRQTDTAAQCSIQTFRITIVVVPDLVDVTTWIAYGGEVAIDRMIACSCREGGYPTAPYIHQSLDQYPDTEAWSGSHFISVLLEIIEQGVIGAVHTEIQRPGNTRNYKYWVLNVCISLSLSFSSCSRMLRFLDL